MTTALADQDWDDSIKALVAVPDVLSMMNEQLDWTTKLGDTVLAQQADVMDAIQRLRLKAQANGKLESTAQQKVSVSEPEGSAQPVVVIEQASPETVYVPYYDPAVVYGPWPYPDYQPYYFRPGPGWVVGGAIATGLAWSAGFAIGNAIWGDGFDWRHNDIRVNVNRNVNINNKNVNVTNWQHNSVHRRGVSYNNTQVKNKFANANIKAGDKKLDFRGRGGEQVIKPGAGGGPSLTSAASCPVKAAWRTRGRISAGRGRARAIWRTRSPISAARDRGRAIWRTRSPISAARDRARAIWRTRNRISAARSQISAAARVVRSLVPAAGPSMSATAPKPRISQSAAMPAWAIAAPIISRSLPANRSRSGSRAAAPRRSRSEDRVVGGHRKPGGGGGKRRR